MGPDRLALFALAGTAGIGLALVEALPGADFVLQAAGIGTLIGTPIAYWRKRNDPQIEVARTIALFSVGFAVLAVFIQLVSLVP